MTTSIWVKFKRAAMHCWPDAPEHRAYLRAPHRHLFGIKVETCVDHDDREIEFHDLLEQSQAIFDAGIEALPLHRSCEMMARRLAEHLARVHKRTFTVEVSEDGECGAVVMAMPV